MTGLRKTEIYSMGFAEIMIYIEIWLRTNLQTDSKEVNNTHCVMAKVKENCWSIGKAYCNFLSARDAMGDSLQGTHTLRVSKDAGKLAYQKHLLMQNILAQIKNATLPQARMILNNYPADPAGQ